MDQTRENEALAEAIVKLFRTEFGEEVVIEPVQPGEWREQEKGFQIETDAGASFTFEIFGTTKAAAACAYFEHIRSVNRFVVEHWLSNNLLDGGHFFRPREKREARRRLAILDAWARQHLPA